VFEQVRAHLAVGGDQLAQDLGLDPVLLPGGSRCDQPFQVNFVRIEKEADELHLVVRFVAYVGQNDDAWTAGELIRIAGNPRLGFGRGVRRGPALGFGPDREVDGEG
jgi:hypothetical protein